MNALASIENTEVSGKHVLVRADLNVPMTAGEVTDATRIKRFAPTVATLADRGAKVIIITHLGRPNGENNPMFSTRPIAQALSGFLGRDVIFVPDSVGSTAERMTAEMQDGDIAVLENVRFYPGETNNEKNFALRLSITGDIYVNDAFSCSHRAHASTHAIAQVMPSFAGHTLLAEVSALTNALDNPERPVAALVGGAKVSTKIEVLKNLVAKTDYLIIGGGMANTFLAAQGYGVGNSLQEQDAHQTALDILELAKQVYCEIVLPSDLVVASEFEANADHQTVDIASVPQDMMALDVGPDTVARIIEVFDKSKTLLWNGPLGAFELEPFGEATFAVAKAAVERTKNANLLTIAGGGDTVAALNAAGVKREFSYVSTAGGAFLEWLEGKELPGIQALRQNQENHQEN